LVLFAEESTCGPLKIIVKRLLPLGGYLGTARRPGLRCKQHKTPTMRIASLLPSATEILFAIGAGPRVVAVTHECDFPAAARTLPVLTSSLLPPELSTQPGTPTTAGQAERIDRHVRASVHGGSSLYALDDELLARLAPDLIITQELCAVCAVSYDIVARAAKRIRGDGPAVISLEPATLEDVYANITTVGELAGAAAGAQVLLSALREREAALRGRRPANPLRTLLLEWTDPPMSGGHWTADLIVLAGGEPVLVHPGANSRPLDWAAVTAADPDVVIVAPCGYDLVHARAAARELAGNAAWTALRAVRAGRAYAMDGNAYVNRPGPRLLDSAEIIATALAGTPAPAEAIEPVTLSSSRSGRNAASTPQ
jgi:iron complex transport system substrate-binding protein